ncbi:hypothetical protein F5876DRAFT_82941 [Lentinula aff. lateritia]|uniref:Uncharacterized protein n=1 Tax=Lentinula aff. lateritia TaxID=2804960 RepID=A0ACC1TIZ6_9AGAR|nr:hypothetical protein F5876DRAFT_82941 [Lentinula aff. lateritia]
MASHRHSNSQTNSKRPSDGDNGQASKRHKPRDDLSEKFLTETRTRTRRIPTLKQAENDDRSQTKELEKLQRELKKMQKENQTYKQNLNEARERENALEHRRSNYEDDYYEQHGRSAPESEDEDDLGTGNELDFRYTGAGSGLGSPKTLFLSSVRTVNVVLQSPPAIPRKSVLKAPVSIHPDQPWWPPLTPPNTQQEPSVVHTPSAIGCIQPPMLMPKPLSTCHAQPPVDPIEPPGLEGESDIELCKLARFTNTSGKLLRHYKGLSKKLVRQCLQSYELTIIALHMYPTSDLQMNWTENIWKYNMSKLLHEDETPFVLSEEVKTLMMRRETRIRKASWDRVAMPFETTFKFKKGTGSKVRKHNKILYLALMTDFGFYYLDPTMRTGLMQAPFIVDAICQILFYNKKAHGVDHEFLFNPIPPATTEHFLSQWSTGIRIPRTLDEDVMNLSFQKHVTWVDEWIALDEKKTMTIMKRWYYLGQKYAGVGGVTGPEDVKMSRKDRKNAVAELHAMKVPDMSEDDEGDEDDEGNDGEDDEGSDNEYRDKNDGKGDYGNNSEDDNGSNSGGENSKDDDNSGGGKKECEDEINNGMEGDDGGLITEGGSGRANGFNVVNLTKLLSPISHPSPEEQYPESHHRTPAVPLKLINLDKPVMISNEPTNMEIEDGMQGTEPVDEISDNKSLRKTKKRPNAMLKRPDISAVPPRPKHIARK